MAPSVKLTLSPPGAHSIEIEEWYSYEVENAILVPADAFSVVAPNPRGDLGIDKIERFCPAKISIDGDVVLNGFVDELRCSVPNSGPQVEITGRDLFGHLADCSASPKTYKTTDLYTLATTIARTWVPTWTTTLTSLPKHSWLKVEPGESVLDVLLRVGKKDRAWIWLDPTGVGVIGRPTYDSAPIHDIHLHFPESPLAMLNNVFDPNVKRSDRDLFSTVTVLGSSGNSAGTYGKTALQKQTETDTDVPVTRPLIIHVGDVKSVAQAAVRATDEVERRGFESTVLEYSCRGFYGSSGQLLTPDATVSVDDEPNGVSGVFYITRVLYTVDAAGAKTRLELHPTGWLA